ncbi:hypothetical protein [Nocardiopsis changdeensis]|uniref:hypothetical protein n=1 Tax=Nocardiopsis changdeensis TaxID=2831969 RepID=UPI003F44AE0B
MRTPREPAPDDTATGQPQEHAEVFDCGALEVSCHLTRWFHDLVLDVLDPLLVWLAGHLFTTPGPTEGIAQVWQTMATTANILYSLLVLAAGFVVMAHHGLQAQTGAREVLPRLVVGWVAGNASLSVVGLATGASTDIAQAVTEDGAAVEKAVHGLDGTVFPMLAEETTAVVLFLLVFVVLLVLWVLVEIVRILIVVLLMVGGPLMLAFHALPQTNALAQMWWRALGAVCLVPIAQAIAFTALTEIFFGADSQALFGMGDIVAGEANLFDLFLLLVLVYVQIRIPFWAYRAVGSPTGRAPGAGMAKTLVRTAVVGAVALAAGGGTASLGAALRSSGGPTGRALRAVRHLHHHRTAELPRRVRPWRFSTLDRTTDRSRHTAFPDRRTRDERLRAAPAPSTPHPRRAPAAGRLHPLHAHERRDAPRSPNAPGHPRHEPRRWIARDHRPPQHPESRRARDTSGRDRTPPRTGAPRPEHPETGQSAQRPRRPARPATGVRPPLRPHPTPTDPRPRRRWWPWPKPHRP